MKDSKNNYLGTYRDYQRYSWYDCVGKAKQRLDYLESLPVSRERNAEIELIVDFFSRLDLTI